MSDLKMPSALRPAGPTITTGHTGPYMSERKDTCETCANWNRLTHGTTDGEGKPMVQAYGECRRYAPGRLVVNWPCTYAPDWCREHKPKDEAR